MLDRFLIRDLLARAGGCRDCGPRAASGTREERIAGAAQAVRQQTRDRGGSTSWTLWCLRPPSDGQYLIEACSTRPDFFYREHNAAIYIDGPPHDTPEQIRAGRGDHAQASGDGLHRHSLSPSRPTGQRSSAGTRTSSERLAHEHCLTIDNPGTLVHARGREWVVLPDTTDELLMVRPVGGLDEEVVGILPAVEPVESATFRLPTADDVGDFASGRLLRDAARLSTRAAAGPFRSFGRIAVEPRPYQLVPLMMALKLDPVRLLIADDVGIGKTIEAAVIARELLDRGEIRRLAVLCPPHLAEQWQRELAREVSHRGGAGAEQHHPAPRARSATWASRSSTGIASPSSRPTSSRPHGEPRTSSSSARSSSSWTKPTAARWPVASGAAASSDSSLLRRIAADKSRHLVLVTATPHSGNEDAFRSLLSLLDTRVRGSAHRPRPRGTSRAFAASLPGTSSSADARTSATTWKPTRLSQSARTRRRPIRFSKEYRALFDDILAFAREYVTAE